MDPVGLNHFTVFQADFALYQARGGAALGQVFLGGPAESITFGGNFEGVEFERQSEEDPETRHTRQSHEIEISNPLVVQRRADPEVARTGSVDDLAFNQQYILVAAYWDIVSLAWMKRTYYGVTAQPARVTGTGATGGRSGHGGPVMTQTLVFRAQRMTLQSGYGAKPALTPGHSGAICYTAADEDLALWRWDDVAEVFIELDSALLTGRASLTPGASGTELAIGGTVRLSASASGVLAPAYVDGQTFDDTVPRLVFRADGRRLASLSATALTALAFVESPTQPDDDAALHFFTTGTPVWLFSIGAQGITAPGFGLLP